MNDKKILKILIVCSVILLLLTVIGVNDSFGLLKWGMLGILLILAALCFSSRRYYWGTVFIIFALLFNPWFHPKFTGAEWVLTDILLSATLIFWFFDYFQNYHKGLLFERLVQNKFPEDKYVLVNATKDLHKKLRRFVESDASPDFVFREKSTGDEFAVECKYRSNYAIGKRSDKGIWWKKSQGERYQRYAQKNNTPVYIAIGIGGNPKSPELISFIPLEIIQKQYYHFIPEKALGQYRQV